MFYAKDNVSQKIDIYLALLDKSVTEGSSSNYWSFFTSAFTEAHELAAGRKTHFQVNNDWYDVVSLLLRNNFDYFRDLNVDQIDNKVFIDVKNFMTTLKQSNSVVNG